MRIIYVALPLLLCACVIEEDVDKELYRYQCGKYAVDVDYEHNGAVLFDGANQVSMFHVPSASGVQFESGLFTGSEKDTKAVFTSGGETASLTMTPNQTFPCIVRGASVEN